MPLQLQYLLIDLQLSPAKQLSLSFSLDHRMIKVLESTYEKMLSNYCIIDWPYNINILLLRVEICLSQLNTEY